MHAHRHLSRILSTVGFIAMLVGIIDPMEGSLIILPGSGLVLLGIFLGQTERKVMAFRVCVFILIAFGVGAEFWLSSVGGFGGPGRSMWWGMLILPYLIGWSMGIWGPDSPRWVLWLGIVVSLYLVAMAIWIKMNPRMPSQYILISILAALGLLTVGGCICRLRKREPGQQ